MKIPQSITIKIPQSKIGLTLSTLYLLASVYLILSQGLFSEGFVVVLLGLPLSYLFVLIHIYVPVNFYIILFTPIVLNVLLLYWIGVGIEKLFSKRKSIVKT